MFLTIAFLSVNRLNTSLRLKIVTLTKYVKYQRKFRRNKGITARAKIFNLILLGDSHIGEIIFKQLVSCNVKPALHETSALIPDTKKAERMH